MVSPGERQRCAEGQAVVIEPRRGRGETPVPPGVVMNFTSQDLATVRRSLGVHKVRGRPVDFAKLWEVPTPFDGVGLAGPALGAPSAVMFLERLIALGARWIVGVGSCGSLQRHVSIGQVILPTGALIEEGTSEHYRGPGVTATPDPPLLEEIRSALNSEGIQPLEGKIWTTDAPFRETVDKVERYQQLGVLGVDMEVSALMTVASFRRVPFASVLVVSDEIGALRWIRGFDDPRYLDNLARVARIAVRVLALRVRPSAKEASSGENR